MNLSLLKRTRVVFSSFLLISVLILFVDFTNIIPERYYDAVLFFQFIPSLLTFKNFIALSGIGFIIIILLNLLFGRVYCSFLCPLGIFMDVISYFSKKIKKIKRYKYLYQKPFNWIRYSFLGIFIMAFLLELTFIVSLLDPYSIFGRVSSGVFRPILIKGNNFIVSVFQNFGAYSIFHVDLKPAPMLVLFVSLFFLILIVTLAFTKGRLYCNTVCPVGTFLGFLSRISVFKISIKKDTCTSCKLCERVCKASCISIPDQKVDFDRCINCYNCLTVCPEASIEYKYISAMNSFKKGNSLKNDVNPNRRQFLGILALIFISKKLRSQRKVVQNTAIIPAERTVPISPPGSLSIDDFNDSCTACHLCISACPTQVLQPAFTDYGLIGFMKAVMDNHAGFCNYECVKCAEVCPTGAIQLFDLEDKKRIQMGKVKFEKGNCIVETEGTDCGACAEHCPTKAVRMVPYKNNLVIPEVDDKICVGCGACEYACPTTPYRAIYVQGNAVHLTADKPKQTEQQKEIEEDFPF
ncbi:MAG: hypothetical protein C0597_09045 [Marinilabiliales bacterium]|nr:MAG: hypothetical protein C0597_09045 [Marinilabiliales bacterium]